jgi:hypothetical protein
MKPHVLFVGAFLPADVYGKLAAHRAMFESLEGFVALEVYDCPWFRRRPGVAPTNEAFLADLAGFLSAGCHMVADADVVRAPLQSPGILQRLRSLTAIGFIPPPATLRAAASPWADALERMWRQYPVGLLQTVQLLMEGADEDAQEEIVAFISERVDVDYFQAIAPSYNAANFLAEPPAVEIPVLYLEPLGVWGGGEAARERFVSLVPHARVERLQEGWGARMHERESGVEVARRVLSFVQEVESGQRS